MILEWAKNMERLLSLLTLSSPDLSSSYTSMGATNKPSLDKLTLLHSLNKIETHYVYALTGDKPSIAKIFEHILSLCSLNKKLTNRYSDRIAIGAMVYVGIPVYTHVHSHSIKHHKGVGRDKSKAQGRSQYCSTAPHHRICDIPRSTWNNRSFAPVRDQFQKHCSLLCDIEKNIFSKCNL